MCKTKKLISKGRQILSQYLRIEETRVLNLEVTGPHEHERCY